MYHKTDSQLDYLEAESRSRMEHASCELEALRQNKQTIEQKFEQEYYNLQNEHAAAILKLKEENLKREREIQEKYSLEKNVLESTSNTDIRDLRARIEELATQNKQLTSNNTTLEHKNSDLIARVDSLEKDRKQLMEDIGTTRTSNKELDATKFENEKTIAKQSVSFQNQN